MKIGHVMAVASAALVTVMMYAVGVPLFIIVLCWLLCFLGVVAAIIAGKSRQREEMALDDLSHNYDKCGCCHGSGFRIKDGQIEDCPFCSPASTVVMHGLCPVCAGSGRKSGALCPVCLGLGKRRK